MPDFPIVDSHVHLCDPTRFGYAWTKSAPSLNRTVLPEHLTKAAAPVKIEQFVFVEVDVDFPQHLDEAAWVAELARGRSAPRPAWSRPCRSSAARRSSRELEQLRQHKILRGIRRLIQNQPDPDFCIRPDFIDGLKLLAAHDLAFDICIFHHQLPNVIKMVRQCPEVRFVLDHIGKPGIKAGIFDPWRQHLKELAALPNVHLQDLRRHHRGRPQELDARAAQALHRPRHRDASASTASCMAATGMCSELAGTYPQWVEIVDWVVEGATRGGEAQAVPRQRHPLLPPRHG